MEKVKLRLVSCDDVHMCYGFTLGCSNNNQVILRGAHPSSPKDYKIKLFDCETVLQVSEWSSVCSHEFCPIIEISFEKGSKKYFAESCNRCPRITFYDSVTKEPLLACDERKFMPGRLVARNEGILLSDLGGDRIIELKWDHDSSKLQPAGWMLDLNLGVVTGLVFLEKWKLIVVVALEKKIVKAFRYPGGEVQWELTGEVAGKAIRPRSICCDQTWGYVCIADFHNRRVLIVEGHTGKVRQVVLKEQCQIIYDVCWNSEQPHLVVKHGQENKSQISLFNVDCVKI